MQFRPFLTSEPYPVPQLVTPTFFAVCVSDESSDDLETWKLYRVLPDEVAAARGYLRIVDESGEDYLYSASRFVTVQFPAEVERQLLSARGG